MKRPKQLLGPPRLQQKHICTPNQLIKLSIGVKIIVGVEVIIVMYTF